jgi:hypothetical protein
VEQVLSSSPPPPVLETPKPTTTTTTTKKEVEDIPLTELHEAARDGELDTLMSLLLLEENKKEVNVRAGPDLWTPLHYASSQNHTACITALFMQGHANPSVFDIRSRPPVFLCTTEASRNAFRLARHDLGEDFATWTGVGPPTTMEELQSQKLKKKQKQKAKKQKQKQAKQQQQQQQQQQETTTTPPPPLPPATLQNLCDFCQKPVRKKDMFTRLEYKYCSTDCVQKHQRELRAAAAMSRFATK